MFSILLLNYFQILNKFEIVVWDIFAFFSLYFVDLAAKLIPIGSNFEENHNKKTHCRYKTLPLCEQRQTTLHSCQKQFSSFGDFKALFVLLTWDILEPQKGML